MYDKRQEKKYRFEGIMEPYILKNRKNDIFKFIFPFKTSNYIIKLMTDSFAKTVINMQALIRHFVTHVTTLSQSHTAKILHIKKYAKKSLLVRPTPTNGF